MRLTFVSIIIIPVAMLLSRRTHPSIRFLLVHISEGNRRHEHYLIGIEDSFQMFVDNWICKECLTIVGVHEVHKESINWDSCNMLVLIFGRSNTDRAENVIEVLRLSIMENASLRYSIKGSIEAHPDHWIPLDSILEILDLPN